MEDLAEDLSFGIATLTAGATGGQNIGTVYLGQTNEINASTRAASR